uniref:Nucleoprotein n=1 Tax=Abdera bunya-like virus TaxID=2805756 RepID=A0A889INF8_9VIRU|nr:MAG: nucleocapsid [Abdera bunya-like virus]
MPVSTSLLRFQRCICYDKYQKRTRRDFTCNCSAKLIKERYLRDPSNKIWRLTPSRIKVAEAECDPILVHHHLKARKPTVAQREFRSKARQTCQKSVSAHIRPVTWDFSNQAGSSKLIQEFSLNLIPSIPEESESFLKRIVALEPTKMAPKQPSQVKINQAMLDELDRIMSTASAIKTIISDSNLAIFLKTFEYKGFDAEKIRKLVAIKHAGFRSGTKFAISEETEVDITGTNSLYVLIAILVGLFNARGNNLDTIKDGLTPRVAQSFEYVVTAMSLHSKVLASGRSKSSETLTLARISAAFPLHSLNMVSRPEFTRRMISLADIGLDQTTALGKCFAHPMAASCLTEEMKSQGLAWITFLASCRLNQVIGGRDKARPDRLWLFHKAALNSRAVQDDHKQEFWESVEYEASQLKTVISAAKTELEQIIPPELIAEMEAYIH